MTEAKSVFLTKMLDRLYAALALGPALNCRPHKSRQRIDLAQLGALDGPDATGIIAKLLSADRSVKLNAPLAPKAQRLEGDEDDQAATPEAGVMRRARDQLRVIRKLGTIAEEAQEFENETGVQSLFLGYPLVHIPPSRAQITGGSRTVLAPVAFIPLDLQVRRGRIPGVDLAASGSGLDLVIPNPALVAWVEKQSGKKIGNVFADEEGVDPWREIRELTATIADLLEIRSAPVPGPTEGILSSPLASDVEGDDPRIVMSAVLGLYPLENINLIKDTEALKEEGKPVGPLKRFLEAKSGISPDASVASGAQVPMARLVTTADPCQVEAVRRSRTSECLVVHGPPGTGKSQTIANVIGDHLGRGERVLFVCDKRTALDVVKQRLDASQVGHLCAVVHDAQKDQKTLYMSIREQLEALADKRTNNAAEGALSSADAQRGAALTLLREHHGAISASYPGEPAFHELVGRWSAIGVAEASGAGAEGLKALRLDEVEAKGPAVRETLERADRISYASNPWKLAIGDDLKTWLGRSSIECEGQLDALVDSLDQALATAESLELPLVADGLTAQADARDSLAADLDVLVRANLASSLCRWATKLDEASQASAVLAETAQHRRALSNSPAESELSAIERASPISLSEVGALESALRSYLAVAIRWFAFFAFIRRAKAKKAASRLGLMWSVSNGERAVRFLEALRNRYVLQDVARSQLRMVAWAGMADAALVETLDGEAHVLAFIAQLNKPEHAQIRPHLVRCCSTPDSAARLVELLKASASRARGLAKAHAQLMDVTFLNSEAKRALAQESCKGIGVARLIRGLRRALPTVEHLLRIQVALDGMPKALSRACKEQMDAGVGAEHAWSALERRVLSNTISSRIQTRPGLTRLDGHGIEGIHGRLEALDDERVSLVRQYIDHWWTERQRTTLLSATGTRLSAVGAHLKQRLMTRGSRVLKLRQVIAEGLGKKELDPIFDLRPVWMASPETVAQVFPREAIFDVVIFDESSQCKLEQAIPVLTRARRVVIAGDPKQLPPSRFFESASVQTEAEEPETDQEFFEIQQSENEDLLNAALNLQIDQAYLDVHYRSTNADLIAFSNEHFYDRRLQALPAHPARFARNAPISLTAVNGVYEKQVNRIEAEAVVGRIKELLSRPEVPSIGIASFNLRQKDAILEALEDATASDAKFAEQLQAAKSRTREGVFEGLFVKNLENVQGDERDHMIISTTYGPDPKGKFYRRFGPLGTAGGGRRLNVLVTRARQHVHLITSVPRERYAVADPIPSGTLPSGSWLLYAYLRRAEELAERYAELNAAKASVTSTFPVEMRETSTPSEWAKQLALALAKQHGFQSTVHYGNDGFLVDVAGVPPGKTLEDAIGILCDGTRYDKFADPVEWDLFRTRLLKRLGWVLKRVWSPSYFRDSAESLRSICYAGKPAEASERQTRPGLMRIAT